MRLASNSAACLLLAAHGVHGWGAIGHETVGYALSNLFLSPKALSFVQSSLGSEYSESLGPAAPWADEVRSEPAFSWSAPFHFVDAEDSPPTSCSVEQTRDCNSGTCILSAIANYTTRVVDTELSMEQRQEALKFIGENTSTFGSVRYTGLYLCVMADHFIGDIGQPLHVEAIEVGGNDIHAVCNGERTNLHAVRDSGIINIFLKSQYSNSATVWATSLFQRIQTGDFKSLTSSWLSCSSTTELVNNRRRSIEDDINGLVSEAIITPLECPLVWARESNAYDCSFVFSYTGFSDLCTSTYAIGAQPIIEEQIAKQGYRLAAWLNVLFDGSTGL
ncbi:nuclease Le1 [Lentinula aciculospora]|uniref:Nuclease Le1 n=1 Tax=Lentinula aciculospora TaxID=153920 RepID=A0A9W8ZZB1_9AGAR|nr:nuclease Le1 [Lentinula aciculospora]